MSRSVLNLPVLLALVAVLLAGAVSTLILMFAPDQAWEWFAAIAATFISAFLAITVGLILFNQQSAQNDKQELKRLRDLLDIELTDTLKNLKETKPLKRWLNGDLAEVRLTHTRSLVLEDAGRSGLFDTKQTEDMFCLVRMMNIYNAQVSFVLTLLPIAESQKDQAMLRQLFDSCEKHCENTSQFGDELHRSITSDREEQNRDREQRSIP